MNLAERIDALLPQTQCTRCGYPACRPYAEALARGEAAPNLCEPGGAALIPVLAAVLDIPPLPPAHPPASVQVAWIREADCIGCARCLPACPVDAIVGARRLAHTVLASDCTGCGLCLPPCPVDCIDLVPPPSDWRAPEAGLNRSRYQRHSARLAARAEARGRTRAAAAEDADAAAPQGAAQALPSMAERRAAMIAAARAAAAARRGEA